jgi:alcohol dehydrogenase class IV
MFAGTHDRTDDFYIDFLLNAIESFSHEMKIPRLAQAGVRPEDFQKIVRATENKNNPVALGHDEMLEVLEMAS